MIAITLEITLITFLFINCENFEAVKKNIKVKIKTEAKATIPTDWFVKLLPISETETITDVIAAGPAIMGVAKGNTLTFSELKSMSSSFLCCLLSNNISIEIINKMMPPPIVNAGKDIFK
jgi:hypothetical protein